MRYLLSTILILGYLVFCLPRHLSAQGSGTFKVAKADLLKLRGFGVGFEYYSGHKNVSKLFRFKRKPKEEYKTGKGFYASYFNWDRNKKFHYYIDGGIVLWGNQQLNEEKTLMQRSALLQFTGSYPMGSFAIIARAGGLLNYNTINTQTSSELIQTKNKGISVVGGIGLSYSLSISRRSYLPIRVFISRVNDVYTLSGTAIIPLILLK